MRGKLDESLRRLFETGLFDDVSLRPAGRRAGGQGASRTRSSTGSRSRGTSGSTDDVLTNEIQLRPRVVYTRARVQNAVSRILELYRRNGRYAARVEPKIIELDQNRVDLVFEINEGPLTGVGGINFIGNEKFSDSTLRGAIQTTESAWYRFLTSRRHLRSRPAPASTRSCCGGSISPAAMPTSRWSRPWPS